MVGCLLCDQTGTIVYSLIWTTDMFLGVNTVSSHCTSIRPQSVIHQISQPSHSVIAVIAYAVFVFTESRCATIRTYDPENSQSG